MTHPHGWPRTCAECGEQWTRNADRLERQRLLTEGRLPWVEEIPQDDPYVCPYCCASMWRRQDW